jgi:hypothetical protein
MHSGPGAVNGDRETVNGDRETSGRVFGRWLSGPGRTSPPPGLERAVRLWRSFYAPERPLPVSVEHLLASGGVSAGLMVVGTFCWCWRERCQRKSALQLIDKLGEVGEEDS